MNGCGDKVINVSNKWMKCGVIKMYNAWMWCGVKQMDNQWFWLQGDKKGQ